MELICTETYNDIRFTLEEGQSTASIPYLTDEFKASLLADYPHKFKRANKAEKDSAIEVEVKEDKLSKRIIKK